MRTVVVAVGQQAYKDHRLTASAGLTVVGRAVRLGDADRRRRRVGGVVQPEGRMGGGPGLQVGLTAGRA